MCMEDVLIARQKTGRIVAYKSDATGRFSVPADPKRMSIRFPAASTNWGISPTSSADPTDYMPIVNSGLTDVSVVLTIDTDGSIVTAGFSVNGAAPNTKFLVLETRLDRDK